MLKLNLLWIFFWTFFIYVWKWQKTTRRFIYFVKEVREVFKSNFHKFSIWKYILAYFSILYTHTHIHVHVLGILGSKCKWRQVVGCYLKFKFQQKIQPGMFTWIYTCFLMNTLKLPFINWPRTRFISNKKNYLFVWKLFINFIFF